MKPFSLACENNKGPILDVLSECLSDCASVLEIGSGTGQHAVYFAKHLPHLCWQPSDLSHNLAGIRAWMDEYMLHNLKAPFSLDVDLEWPVDTYDAVFTANTLHIVSWAQVETMICEVSRLLTERGKLVIYGPFNYGYSYTSESNESFDQWLKARDPLSGIRDFEAVNALALKAGLTLRADYAMPANNRTLVWEKA